MCEKSDPNKKLASWEDVAYFNMIQTDALAQIMVQKGGMYKEEYTKRIKKNYCNKRSDAYVTH